MKYTTLLMDADDTIFDFQKCEREALKKTLLHYGLNYDEEINERFSTINAALWRKFEISQISRSELRIQRFRELIEQCLHGFRNADLLAEHYVQELSEQAILIEGTDAALEKLSETFDVYIITNGLKTVQRGRFSCTNITRYIRKLYISDEIGMNKPSKDFFDYVLADLPEKDKSKILVVGDSLTSDMQGGKNAGLDTCLFDPMNKVQLPHELCNYKIIHLTDIFKFASEEI